MNALTDTLSRRKALSILGTATVAVAAGGAAGANHDSPSPLAGLFDDYRLAKADYNAAYEALNVEAGRICEMQPEPEPRIMPAAVRAVKDSGGSIKDAANPDHPDYLGPEYEDEYRAYTLEGYFQTQKEIREYREMADADPAHKAANDRVDALYAEYERAIGAVNDHPASSIEDLRYKIAVALSVNSTAEVTEQAMRENPVGRYFALQQVMQDLARLG